MEDNLKLESPFYTPEAIERFLRPLFGETSSAFFDSEVLNDQRVLDALNAAFRYSVEQSDEFRS